jgi:uridine kinase
MARSVPTRKDLLKSIAGEILHNYGRGRTLVAVDGRHGAGQQQFDDFFRPRADREREGWLDGVAHYREAYDYSLLRRVLVDPFHTGGSTGFVLTGFDEVRDQPIFQPKWMSAGPDAVLIVEGVFLHRPELARMWNYSIWLDTPAGQPGESGPDQSEMARDFASDEAYLAKVGPGELATVILDNQDPANPIRVFDDSC